MYRSVLTEALNQALRYLDSLDGVKVAPSATAEQLVRRLDGPLPEGPADAKQVLEQLIAGSEEGLSHSMSGRFFGWVIGGAVPAALAADWMTSVWDQNAALYAVAPSAAVVEQVAGRWLLELLQLPPQCSFAFVTGCQMAHVTCLAAARNHCLAQRGWDVERQGLCGAPAIGVYTSAQRHGTLERALRLLGLGTDCVRIVGRGQGGRETLDAESLGKALRGAPEGQISIVALQAGEVNAGQFDDFPSLIEVAHQQRAWVHVDGAFGLWAAVSDRHRHLLRGVERADSWATDGHKWLNVPYDCGYAFVAHRDAHRRAFSQPAAYLAHTQGQRDPLDWNPDHSRRARGFATYAAIKSLGRAGIAEMVERNCRQANEMIDALERQPHARVVCRSPINQGLVRFVDPRSGAQEIHHEAFTRRVLEAVCDSGEALFTSTVWNGVCCARVSVSGWNTSEQDVRRAIAVVAEMSEQIAATVALEPLSALQ